MRSGLDSGTGSESETGPDRVSGPSPGSEPDLESGCDENWTRPGTGMHDLVHILSLIFCADNGDI